MASLLDFVKRSWLLFATAAGAVISGRGYLQFARDHPVDGMYVIAMATVGSAWLACLYYVVARQQVTTTIYRTFPRWKRVSAGIGLLLIPAAGLFALQLYSDTRDQIFDVAVARFTPATDNGVTIDQEIARQLGRIPTEADLKLDPVDLEIPSNALSARPKLGPMNVDAAVWGWHRIVDTTVGRVEVIGYFEPLEQVPAFVARTEYERECELRDLKSISSQIANEISASILLGLSSKRVANGKAAAAVPVLSELTRDASTPLVIRGHAFALLAVALRSLRRDGDGRPALKNALSELDEAARPLDQRISLWKRPDPDIGPPRPRGDRPSDQRLSNAFVSLGDALWRFGARHDAQRAYARAKEYSSVQLPMVWQKEETLGRELRSFGDYR